MANLKYLKERKKGMSRRDLLSGSTKLAVLGGLAGTGAAAGGLAGGALTASKPAKAAEGGAAHIAPGELDEYYGFWSSGQTGEVRILGLPSMRELMRIPVFNRCSATGWGQTNESRKILTEGLLPETRDYLEAQGGVWHNGDAHHPHMSFTEIGRAHV